MEKLKINKYLKKSHNGPKNNSRSHKNVSKQKYFTKLSKITATRYFLLKQ